MPARAQRGVLKARRERVADRMPEQDQPSREGDVTTRRATRSAAMPVEHAPDLASRARRRSRGRRRGRRRTGSLIGAADSSPAPRRPSAGAPCPRRPAPRRARDDAAPWRGSGRCPRRCSRVSCRARCALRSRPRSRPTSSAPSDAGAPSHALVPALDDLDVDQPALDRDLARDRFGERAAAGVAGADEEDASCRVHASPMRSGALSRRRRRGIAPGRITRGRAARAVHHRRRRRRREASAVEHAERAARDGVAPLLHESRRRHRRRNPGPVRARGRDRVAVRADQPLQRRGAASSAPRCRPSGPRSAIGHAALAAGQHERERAGPVPRREAAPRSWAGAGRAARASRCRR